MESLYKQHTIDPKQFFFVALLKERCAGKKKTTRTSAVLLQDIGEEIDKPCRTQFLTKLKIGWKVVGWFFGMPLFSRWEGHLLKGVSENPLQCRSFRSYLLRKFLRGLILGYVLIAGGIWKETFWLQTLSTLTWPGLLIRPWMCCKKAIQRIIGTLMWIENYRNHGPDSRSSQIWVRKHPQGAMDYRKTEARQCEKVERHTLSTRMIKTSKKPLNTQEKSWKFQWKPLCLARWRRRRFRSNIENSIADPNKIHKIKACMHRRSSRVCEKAFGKNSTERSWRSHCWKGVHCHYNLVSKFIPMLQAMKIPDAKAAVDKEWEKLEKLPAWHMAKVNSQKEVILESQKEQRTVHFATLMDNCHLKKCGVGHKRSEIQRLGCAPRWRCERRFRLTRCSHRTGSVCVSSDGRKMWWMSSQGHRTAQDRQPTQCHFALGF